MPVRTSLVGALALVAALALAACGGSPPDPESSEPGAQTAAARAVDEVKVVAVGDIVCAPGSRVTATRCRHGDTAALAQQLDPDVVIGLGDLQYEAGSLRAFRNAYDQSWGALKPKELQR